MDQRPADPYRLLDPETLLDPYPLYAELRANEPVHYSEAWSSWIVTRYDDVLAGFRDPRLCCDRSSTYAKALPAPVIEQLRPILDNLGSWALLVDPPRHTRLRGLVNKAFTPALVQALRPRIVTLVEALLDRVEAAGKMDIVADLASPLPVSVIAHMLGVREEDGDKLKSWSNALARFIGSGRPTPEAAAAALRGVVEMEAYFRDIIADRRRAPQDDLITALVTAQEEGQILNDRELLSTCSMVLFGGHETTTNLITNAAAILLERPEQAARLREETTRMPAAVEEFLRFDSPVQRMGRIAGEDLAIRGASIKKGQLVWLMMGSANRDEGQFPGADTLDLGRRDNKHLSFGIGAHYCVGAALGRMEAEIAIGSLLRRFPSLRASPEAPVRIRSATLRGYESLPVLV
ncbi:MAG: cytochrome P450 [Polyangiaceae bacterium]